MGFFAVVHPKRHERRFNVVRCHLNFFVLRGRYSGVCEFLWDVGLVLRPEDDAREAELQLALPFGTCDDSFEDLSAKVLDQRVATQVFGEHVQVMNSKIVVPSYEAPLAVVAVPKHMVKRIADASAAERSLWSMTVALDPNELTYMRVRFLVVRPGPIWQWQSSRLMPDAALLDLRVADIRGASTDNWLHLSEHVAPIPYLNAFVIAPVAYRLRANHPDVRYVRLIESTTWGTYLGRKTRGPLAVFHWKHKDVEPISRDKPFQGFLEFETSRHTYSFVDILRLAVAVTVISVLVGAVAGTEPPWFSQAKVWAGSVYSWAVGLGLFAFVARLRLAAALYTKATEIWRERRMRRPRT